MGTVIVIVIIVVVLGLILGHGQDEKEIDKLKGSLSYEVAIAIKKALAARGYILKGKKDSYDDPDFSSVDNVIVGEFRIYEPTGSLTVGYLKFSGNPRKAFFKSDLWLMTDNAKIKWKGVYYYAITNFNIGVSIKSCEECKDIPEYINIAAQVMIDSGYAFKHPDWIYEEPRMREYLNVMFQ